MRNPLHIGRPRQPGDRGGMRDYGQYTSPSGIGPARRLFPARLNGGMSSAMTFKRHQLGVV